MKANEIPEKIYLSSNSFKISDYVTKTVTTKRDGDLEYILMNAFIEKAENYLRTNCQKFILTEKDIKDFVNFMKGE